MVEWEMERGRQKLACTAWKARRRKLQGTREWARGEPKKRGRGLEDVLLGWESKPL